MKIISYILVLCALKLVAAQRTPAEPQSGAVWIKNVTVHNGLGQKMSNAHVLFDKGKISYVGTQMPNNTQARVIDGSGQHLYPGFIATNATLGLLEIGAVKASHDAEEVGSINPNVRSLVAYNAESKITETVRPNGVLLAQIAPQSGRFSGMSSVVQLDAWNWKDAAVRENDGVHMNWPTLWGNSNQSSYAKRKESYESDIEELERLLLRAKNFDGKSKSPKLAALQTLFTQNKTLYVHVNWAQDMLRAIALKEKLGVPKMVFVGGYDALDVAEELKKHNIAVLVGRVHELPFRADDDLNHAFVLPKLLSDAGVLVGLENQGDMPEMNTRNYPFYGGTMVGYGMEYEQAIKVLTYNTAKILGIDSTYGSIETGKSATLFLSKGDALDVRSNKLTHAFIDGREIDLNTFQDDLYRKYGKKLGVETP